MTVDAINQILFVPASWSVLSFCVLLLIDRSRNTSSNILHSLLLLTSCSIVLIPVFRFLLPAWEWPFLPAFMQVDVEVSFSGYFALLVGFYVSVVLYLWVRRAMSIIFAYKLAAQGESVAERSHELILLRLAQRLHIRKPVTLLYIKDLPVPVTLGFFRCFILLPANSIFWSREMTEHFLTHELAHIRRVDWLTQHIAYFVSAIFWFIPLTWYLHRRMQWHAELSCDDTVLQLHGDRSVYANLLLQVSSRQCVLQGAIGLIEASEHFHRIKAVLDGSRVGPRHSSNVYIYPFILLCMIALLSSVHLVVSPETRPVYWQAAPLSIAKANQIEEVPKENSLADPFTDDKKEIVIPGATPLPSLTVSSVDSLAIAPPENMSNRPEPVVVNRSVPTELSVFRQWQMPQLVIEKRHIPKYPSAALRRGKEGNVTLVFNVSESGEVENAAVLESSNHADLDRAALKAVKKYRYRPPMLNGEPVAVDQVTEVFYFQLQEDAK